MLVPPPAPDEEERLASLRSLEILDTPAEERFDRITRIAASVFQTPMAMISLVDADRQWFKSHLGVEVSETPRAISLCGHGILSSEPFIVTDTLTDRRFSDNPLVVGEPYIRFYAGIPLDDGQGHKLGMLCVLDQVPREFTPEQVELLRELTVWAESELRTIGLDRALIQHKEALNRLDTVTETLLDAFVVTEADGTLLALNSVAERTFGYGRTEVIGQNVELLLPEHTGAHGDRQSLGQAYSDGSPLTGFQGETLARRKGGETFPAEVSISQMTDQGRILLVAIVRDITERRRAEDALRASEERYRDLSDLAPIGIFKSDPRGRCLYVNRRWSEMTELSLQDVFDMGWLSAVHPDDAEAVVAGWTTVIEQRQPKRLEFRFLTTGGRVIWVSARLAPQVDESGELTGIIGAVSDVTEQRAMEMALRTSEEIHRSVIDSMTEGIIIQDKNSRLVGCNAAAERILGLSVDRLLEWAAPKAENWDALRADGTSFPAEEHPSAITLHTGQSCSNVIMGIPRHGGEPRWISINSQPLQWEGGSDPWGVSCTFTDVTERHAVDRMKSEFISVVSHELRTPLASIRGALGLLAGGVLGTIESRAQRMLDIAITNTDRLGRLVSDILDIERIESGTVGLSRRTTDAATLVAQAVEVMGDMAEKAGVTLAVQVEPLPLWVDDDRMVQTLTNLISNAIKFSPEGSTVTITATARHGFARFEIADQGRGIPEDKIEHIFERFHQVDASDSRAKGGTGLGLAICRSIVEQHGGLIWVRSRLGQGSRFLFTLPSAGEASSSSQRHGPTILVFGRDHRIPAAVREAIGDLGYVTASPKTLEQATAIAKGNRPDIMLLDLDVPGLDGWQTLLTLRSDPPLRNIPVIVLGCDEHAVPSTLNAVLDADREAVRALVVENDDTVRSAVLDTLTKHGVDCAEAHRVDEALDILERVGPDLVLVGLGSIDDSWHPLTQSILDSGRCLALAGAWPAQPPADLAAGHSSPLPERVLRRVVGLAIAFARYDTQGMK